ncbi:MAG: hypothetical protein HY343_00950 [Lentisphaerae bacterium]|nr:hypothetical protein [Lentisphaerota bacterium]
MRTMKAVLVLALAWVFVQAAWSVNTNNNGLRGNFDNASCIFRDNNNRLRRIDRHGNVTNVFNIDVTVNNFYLSPQGPLYVVFESPQVLADSNSYILARVDITNNIVEGIDSNLTSITLDTSGVQPGIQYDAAGNIYYTTSGGNGLMLKKYQDRDHIYSLINDNISLNCWVVQSNGVVLLGGTTMSTSAKWFRQLSTNNNLATIFSGAIPNYLTLLPDNKVYMGVGELWTTAGGTYGGGTFFGVYRFSDITQAVWSNRYIGAFPEYYNPSATNNAYSDEFNAVAIASNHPSINSNVSFAYSTCYYRNRPNKSLSISNTVYHHYNYYYASPGAFIARYCPTVDLIETRELDTVTLMDKMNHLLVLAGTKSGVNRLVLMDPVTTNEISLLSEEIEIYHLTGLADGSVWFDGLRFNGNQYIIGQVEVSVSYGLNGRLTPRSTLTVMATLDAKPNDLLGLSGTDRLDKPTGLSASDGTYADKVALTWTGVSNATSYSVYRNTTVDNDDLNALGTATATAYEDTTTQSGTLYYYWVKAVNATNWSSFSDVDTGYSGSTPAPGGTNTSTQAQGDYNGDGISDMALFDDNTGSWYIRTVAGTTLAWAVPWGWPGAVPVSGDYNGDGISDMGVFDSNTGSWYIRSLVDTTAGTTIAWGTPWGWPGAVPVSGDYNGDDRSDLGIFDSNTGYWYVYSLTGAALAWQVPWGWPGARAVPGDYDADGIADMAVFDSNTGSWYIRSVAGVTIAWGTPWGWPGAIPVSGDYNSDDRSDLGIFDSNTGYWYVSSLTGSALVWQVQWGWPGAVAVSGDYDGDGISDLAVFDSNTGSWYIRSVAGVTIAWGIPWGWPGGTPVGKPIP